MTKSAVVRVGVHEAKTRCPSSSQNRRLGTDEGAFVVPDDVDAPLPDDVLETFAG